MKSKLFRLSLATALTVPAVIAVIPTHTEAATVTFKDVSKSYVYHDIINDMGGQGIITGYEDGTFRPNKELTRAGMARILVVAFDLKVKANYDFADVPASHAYNKDVRALYYKRRRK